MAIVTRSLPSLLILVAVVLGGGTAIGLLTGPGEWFAGLHQPSFAPPNWVFAPVWTVLYVMIAVVGWLVWRSETPARSVLLLLWALQLALNFLWSPLFFGLHRISMAFVDIVALLAVIVMFMVIAQRAGQALVVWLMAPYAAWVGFATLLNGAYERLNA